MTEKVPVPSQGKPASGVTWQDIATQLFAVDGNGFFEEHATPLQRESYEIRAKAVLALFSAHAETAPKDAIYDVVLKELETKHIMPTSVMLATRITNAIVALRSPAAIDDEDSYERGFRAGYECAGCQPQPEGDK